MTTWILGLHSFANLVSASAVIHGNFKFTPRHGKWLVIIYIRQFVNLTPPLVNAGSLMARRMLCGLVSFNAVNNCSRLY
jgi:hypothetical protein